MKKYKGYSYTRTDTTTTVRYERAGRWVERVMPVYDIPELKPAGQRPFLTTEQQVRDYINSHVEGLPPVRGDTPQRIISARARRGMTQQEVGEALGYTGGYARVSVARWEAGTTPVPMDKIRPLSELLHIEVVSLLP